MLYKKRIIYILVALFSFTTILAQKKDIRIKVSSLPLSCDTTLLNKAGYGQQYRGYVDRINENVLTNLKATKRVNVFSKNSAKSADQAAEDATMKHLESGSGEFFFADEFTDPDYSLSGKISKVGFVSLGISGFKATVSFTVQVQDPKTGDIVEQMDFVGQGKPQMSKTDAFPDALKMTNEDQKTWFKSIFNLRTTIVLIDAKTKTTAKMVTIAGGKDAGLTKKDQFIVKQIKEVNGYSVETIIATLKVKTIGGGTTQCQVLKGGKDLLSLFGSDGEGLICELKGKR